VVAVTAVIAVNNFAWAILHAYDKIETPNNYLAQK
jgi:hypothetical protein